MHEVEHELIVEGTRVALENIRERRKREGGGETG
jgi:hypothetical protein